MIKKPVAIILGLILLLGGLFKCDAFSAEGTDEEFYEGILQHTEEILRRLEPPTDVPFLPEEYTILCIPEEKTALNWENGNWHSVQFKLEKRLIIKSSNNDCSEERKTSDVSISYLTTKSVCLNERLMGHDYDNGNSKSCVEEYWKLGKWDTKISCYPKIFLKPNGWYHYAHVHPQLAEQPEKNSMFVEVGKCSMIAP